MHEVCASGVTEEVIMNLVGEFEFPRRSVTAKLRKLNYDVPAKPATPPVFSPEETVELRDFLEANSGVFNAEEISEKVCSGKFTARQINGKALSLELTGNVKPAEKKITPKLFTDDEEAVIREMTEGGSYIEDIAAKVNKTVPSVRGKLLSMGMKAPQRDKKEGRKDAYEGIGLIAAEKTVAELAVHFEKTERGVKTVLTRRDLSCKDYTPKKSASAD